MSLSLYLILFGLVTAGITFPLAFYVHRRKGFTPRSSARMAGILAFAFTTPPLLFLLSVNFGRPVAFTFAAIVIALTFFLPRPKKHG